LKAKVSNEKPRGEASLRGHLRGEDKAGADKTEKKEGAEAKPEGEQKEQSGSSAYVPKEPEKDTQLQYALNFLRGKATEATVSGTSRDAERKPN